MSRLVLHGRVLRGSWGGPDKTILNSPRFLRSSYPMLCMYLRHPNDPYFSALAERARHWGAELVAVDDFGPLDWRVLRRAREVCRRHAPRIWHGHDYKSNLLGILLGRMRHMHLVTTVHGWVKHTWKTPLYYAIDRLCLRRYEAVICVSQDLYRASRRLGVVEGRCHLVPNAIDTDEFRRRRPRAEAKAAVGAGAGPFLIGSIGRLSTEKGFDILIRALAMLSAEGLDAELWIAGEGDRERELRGLISEVGVGHRVKLLGFRTDTPILYEAMDVFALASLREGLPNVVLEAMAMGVPVVATRVAGVPEVVQDGENGLVVAPASPEALAAAIRKLIREKDLRDQLGAAGRVTIERSFSFSRRMEAIRAIYDAILDGGARRAGPPR